MLSLRKAEFSQTAEQACGWIFLSLFLPAAVNVVQSQKFHSLFAATRTAELLVFAIFSENDDAECVSLGLVDGFCILVCAFSANSANSMFHFLEGWEEFFRELKNSFAFAAFSRFWLPGISS